MDEKKEKSFKNREELIEAAMIEFGEKGYENASLNNILKEAEISKGTFYYHYENKEDLYMCLMDIIGEEKLRFMSKEMASMNLNEDIFTILKAFIKSGMKFAHKNPHINKFTQGFVREWGSPVHREILNKYYIDRADYLNQIAKKYGFKNMDNIIQRAYEREEIREDLPKEFVINIINYLFLNLHQIVNPKGLDEYEKNANYLVDFLRDGLAKKQ